ncbi:MAG: hypothetical protein JSV80_02005, partial [Acidobacteriota bacterium]
HELSLIGSGITRLGWPSIDAAEASARVRSLGDACAACDGWARVERRPSGIDGHLGALVPAPAAAPMMARLKQALDPEGRFPPPPFLVSNDPLHDDDA